MTQLPNEQTRAHARTASIFHAVVGWLILCAGIGFSVTLARLVSEWFNLGPGGLSALQAILVSALVVPAVLLLRRKINHKSL